MKREILCPACAPALAEALGKDLSRSVAVVIEPYADERVRFELGALRGPVRCDHCNADLPASAEAWCVTVWSTRAGIPWSRWEPAYIATGGSEP